MTDNAALDQRIQDQLIQEDIAELMREWKDVDYWLWDEFYKAKKAAADRLSQANQESVCSLVAYCGHSQADFEKVLKKIKKYSRDSFFKRICQGFHRNWRSMTMPFRSL